MSAARSRAVPTSEPPANDDRDDPTGGLAPDQLQRLARGLTERLFVDTVTPAGLLCPECARSLAVEEREEGRDR